MFKSPGQRLVGWWFLGQSRTSAGSFCVWPSSYVGEVSGGWKVPHVVHAIKNVILIENIFCAKFHTVTGFLFLQIFKRPHTHLSACQQHSFLQDVQMVSGVHFLGGVAVSLVVVGYSPCKLGIMAICWWWRIPMLRIWGFCFFALGDVFFLCGSHGALRVYFVMCAWCVWCAFCWDAWARFVRFGGCALKFGFQHTRCNFL